MIFSFDSFELDTSRVELRNAGIAVAIEPQVFSLLVLLAEGQGRMISKDEIVEKVWEGRIVSDAAIASRIKSARQALGDDGKTQKFIKTVHGQGFRFDASIITSAKTGTSAQVNESQAPQQAAVPSKALPTEVGSRPSIAVLPFRLVGAAGPYGSISDALPQDIITELSRLRWLFVIARGSSFRFREADPDAMRIGQALNVRYCLSGVVEVTGRRLTILTELSDTRDGGIVWADRFNASVEDVHAVRSEILQKIVVALEVQIPLNEARLARLSAPENLNAWSAYHLGLQHMYRFNRKDNEVAQGLFAKAVEQDPQFSRAHAGLSFVYFQNAFLKYTDNHQVQVDAARRHAELGLEIDPMDPFANCTMGRSFWLTGDLEGSLPWIDRAVSISPSFAQGVYSRAWADTVLGRGEEGQRSADEAIALSPLDPLMYAMITTRALGHLVCGEESQAADWAERGARAPGAHVLIALIAAVVHHLAGNSDKAQGWARSVRERNNGVTHADFFQSFPFAEPSIRQRLTGALIEMGF